MYVMPKEPIPDRLYKYFPNADYVFPTPTLRYTPPHLLNDPEEGIPSLDNNFSLDFLAATARMAGLVMTIADLKKLAADLKRDDPEITYKRFSALHKKNNLGILSLASDPFNQTMWSHYASSHKGVVFELDMNHQVFESKEGFSEFGPVHYMDKRPPGTISSPEEMRAWYFVKSLAWEYEHEYRRITDHTDRLNACPGVPGTVFLPPDAITAIYLGLNIEDSFLEQALAYCVKNSIPCGRIHRDPLGYRLNALDLKIPR